MIIQRLSQEMINTICQFALKQNEAELLKLVGQNVCINGQYNTQSPVSLLAQRGEKEAVTFLINKFQADPGMAVYGAAQSEDINYVNELREQYTVREEVAICGSVRGGYVDRYLYPYSVLGPYVFVHLGLDVIIYHAALGGQKDYIEGLIDQLEQKNVNVLALYKAVVKGAAQSWDIKYAEKWIRRMRDQDKWNDPGDYGLVVSAACRNIANLQEALKYLSLIENDTFRRILARDLYVQLSQQNQLMPSKEEIPSAKELYQLSKKWNRLMDKAHGKGLSYDSARLWTRDLEHYSLCTRELYECFVVPAEICSEIARFLVSDHSQQKESESLLLQTDQLLAELNRHRSQKDFLLHTLEYYYQYGGGREIGFFSRRRDEQRRKENIMKQLKEIGTEEQLITFLQTQIDELSTQPSSSAASESGLLKILRNHYQRLCAQNEIDNCMRHHP